MILPLRKQAAEIMKMFEFLPQRLMKVSLDISYFTDRQITDRCFNALSHWIRTNSDSLNELSIKASQSRQSPESLENLSKAIEICSNLMSINLIGLRY